jgi:hypothetical protein
MRKLLPLLLAVIGLAMGVGGGLALRPPVEPAGEAPETEPAHEVSAPAREPAPGTEYDYVQINNQFVVPVVKQGSVAALVILSLSLEITKGSREAVYAREPKLRDGLLQVLFDHANAGGFDNDFIAPTRIAALRTALREQAASVLGPILRGVLIQDIVRQDN